MRIALLSLTYPPLSYEGIPRQRAILAAGLAQLGHDVHVITCGPRDALQIDAGVHIRTMSYPDTIHFTPDAEINSTIGMSMRLWEGVLAEADQKPFDIIDLPLWAAQGLITLKRAPGPCLVWLQTTTAQLRNLGQLPNTIATKMLIDLERNCLETATGWLADSQIALTSTQDDYKVQQPTQTAVVHLGIPAMPLIERPVAAKAEILVVGRLEQRKGTPLLIDLLPTILRAHPNAQVRFIGRDNSAYDGWYAQHKLTYAETFAQRAPDLIQRVFFEGLVSEERLQACYQQADLFVVSSQYESFGLIYLEAMRAGLPVVTFDSGGAQEIFPHAEQDGALIAAAHDYQRFCQLIEQLLSNAALRQEIGVRGYQRFQQKFLDTLMVQSTVAYYEQVIAYDRQRRAGANIYHVAETISDHDGVSQIALHTTHYLAAIVQQPTLLVRSAPKQYQDYTAPLETIFERYTSHLVFHYWGFNTATWMLQAVRGRKALYYHNITPPTFFMHGSAIRQHLERGYTQLQLIANQVDLIIGDSSYNLQEFGRYLTTPRPGVVIYPTVDPQTLLVQPYDPALVAQLQANPGTKLLFVGRIAQNKRPDQLIKLLTVYQQQVDPLAQLWLVGSETFDPDYSKELMRLCSQTAAGRQVIFAGKVSDQALYSYYRAADLFICASEHEGFCIPLIHAMAFGLPIIALAAAAVPETVGAGGILVSTWNSEQIALRIQQLLGSPEEIIALRIAQQHELNRFSSQQAIKRLQIVCEFLEHGTIHPDFIEISPGGTI